MRRGRLTRGQGLVEFALLIPLVIFTLFVFIDLAWVTSSYLQLSSAVREATRYGIVHAFNKTEIENFVKDKVTGLDPDRIDFLETPDPDGFLRETPAIIGNQIVIIASYDYQPITPGLNLIRNPEHPILLQVQSFATLAPINQD